ncbi:MAG: 2-polyprenylphenol 6-hydroxylase [Syntrophothermus sp.]
MQLGMIVRRYRHIRRYRRIAEILFKHGFGALISQLDLGRRIPFYRWLRRRQEPKKARLSYGQRLRNALEELGPTFIKLGQLLSTRRDLLPPELVDDLEKLQDEVAPVPFAEIRAQVERELGAPVEELFASFVEEPLAAASIGQVHRAVLPGGEEVVVKVQRPGVEALVRTDLEILLDLARVAEDRFELGAARPVAVVEEFARSIRKELDYRTEAQNIERFRKNFAQSATVVIPGVYWALTSRRVLTMEYMSGVKVSEIDALAVQGIDRRHIARIGAEAFIKQVLIDGFFHADLHPGNIFVRPDGKIALIDFGMVGRLDDETLKQITDLFLAIIEKNSGRVVKGLIGLGAVEGNVGTRELRVDIDGMLESYYDKPLADLQLGEIINELLTVTRRHGIRLPVDLALLGKAMVTMEGVGKQLDPSFNAFTVARPFAAELIKKRLHPQNVVRRSTDELGHLLELLRVLPQRMDAILAKAGQGELEVRIQPGGPNYDRRTRRMETASNRLSLAVVIAGMSIAAAILIGTRAGPQFRGVSVLGVLGVLSVGFLVTWLSIGIWRSGRL